MEREGRNAPRHTHLTVKNIGLLLSIPGVFGGTIQPALAELAFRDQEPPAVQPQNSAPLRAEQSAEVDEVRIVERSIARRWQPVIAREFRSIPAPQKLDSIQMKAEFGEVQEAVARGKMCTCREERVTRWTQAPAVAWNEIARTLVAENKVNPLEASRIYALLSIAQYDATIAVSKAKLEHAREGPQALTWDAVQATEAEDLSAYPSEHLAVGQASYEVLKAFFPKSADKLGEFVTDHRDTRLLLGASFPSDLDIGSAIGKDIAEQVVRYANAHPLPAKPEAPQVIGPGVWKSNVSGTSRGLHPGWGTMPPFLMTQGNQFRAPPPPTFGSEGFHAALKEVREISDNRTPEQLRVAKFWADAPGTFTPPGHWNLIATDLIKQHKLPADQGARILLHLNLAMHDAGISTWETKYHYNLLRPSQADPEISTPIGLPDFPSYTSGHATFSGAASKVLGHFFPSEATTLRAQAEEAALSRVYGGIHYRFDGERGLEAGRKIGALAIERAKAEAETPRTFK